MNPNQKITVIQGSDGKEMQMHSYSQLIKTYPNCPKTVPFAILDENTALSNHSQTLQRLNERGGLYPTEMIAVIAKRPFMPKQDVGKAIESINAHIAIYNKSLLPTETKQADAVKTAEEAAKEYAQYTGINYTPNRLGFIAGVKWQSEQTGPLQSRIDELEKEKHIEQVKRKAVEEQIDALFNENARLKSDIQTDLKTIVAEKDKRIKFLEAEMDNAEKKQMFAIVNFEALEAKDTIVAVFNDYDQAAQTLDRLENNPDDDEIGIYAGEVIELPLPKPPTDK